MRLNRLPRNLSNNAAKTRSYVVKRKIMLYNNRMPIDVITLKAVTEELNEFLSGGRVEKIYQPETDEVTLNVKSGGKYFQLVISANPSHPRIHLTTQKKENSFNAPAFCMLPRKYIGGARILGMHIFNNDRVIRMEFEGKTELKDDRVLYLIVELMGRYSNIILTDKNMVIVDAIRRIHFDQSTTRYILPGLQYVFQPQTRITFDQTDKLKAFFADNPDCGADEILRAISGIGKETAAEIAASSDRFASLTRLIDVTSSSVYRPSLSYSGDKPTDYFVYPYETRKSDWKEFSTLNEALDEYYSLYDREDRKKASSKTVETILKRLQTKTERRIDDNLKRLKDWEKSESIRRKGEFITNYLYLIKPGDEELKCFDYYENKDTSIALDPTLSPARNAQEYFKKYNKLKRAKDSANEQLATLYPQKEYLGSIAVAIESCSLKSEFDEILEELNKLGGYVRKGAPKQRTKPSAPTHLTINGFDVYYGKNNVQNAQVTFTYAAPTDTWVHAKKHHGTHVIIKGTPDEETLLTCCRIAAFLSDAKTSPKVEVDYTQKKFVKKIPSSLPGLVTYTDYKTMICEPLDPEEFLKQK